MREFIVSVCFLDDDGLLPVDGRMRVVSSGSWLDLSLVKGLTVLYLLVIVTLFLVIFCGSI